MAANKTIETQNSVADFLATIKDEKGVRIVQQSLN